MADWYCGSVQYAAIAQFQISHAYSVGDIVRQIAGVSENNMRAFRCTTAGTSAGSEPSWTLTKGATTTSGSAVFTEVTGNSTYNWAVAAPFVRLMFSSSWAAAGDRVFVSDDHAENQTTAQVINVNAGTAAAPIQLICVNHSGSVPPVSADLRTTATITQSTAAGNLNVGGFVYVYGVTFIVSSTGAFQFNISNDGATTAEACKFRLTNAAAQNLNIGLTSADVVSAAIWKNCTVEFGHAGTGIYRIGGAFLWQDTASAIVSGTLPTTLFPGSTAEGTSWTTLDGVDLSALGSGKTIVGASNGRNLYNLSNCRLGSSVTVAATPTQCRNRVEIINCDSGATGYRNEIYDYSGTLTVETTIIRTAGASDGVQAVSWKIVTTANCSRIYPFRAWEIPLWNTATGGAKIATVEMVTDNVTLKDSEAALEVAYLGSASYPLASRVTTAAADLLNAGANIATSTEAWTTTGLTTPVKQKMAASFTPNMAGLVRGTIIISKASQTLYADYKISPLT